MKVGTKSLLFGGHQFVLHSMFTFFGWIKCYGFNNKGYKWWKLIVCFTIHDWGYWGCSDMDGREGEKHVLWAARWAGKYLGGWYNYGQDQRSRYNELCLYHSRFYAKRHNEEPSPLCWADKAGTALMPTWLWVFLCRLTGEINDYTQAYKHREFLGEHKSHKEYFEAYKKHIWKVINEHCT